MVFLMTKLCSSPLNTRKAQLTLCLLICFLCYVGN